MQYELSSLERYVLEQITQANTTSTRERIENVRKESERIKGAFLKEALSDKTKEAFQKYASIHQKGISVLMNAVYDSRPKEYESDKTEIKVVLGELEILLTVLLTQFHEYVTIELAVPKFIKEREALRFYQKIESFTEKLNQFQAPDSLNQLVIDTVKSYSKAEGDIYYSQFFFFQELESLIDNLPMLKENTMSPHRALVEALCRINFNSLYFFSYCKDCVVGLVASQKDIWEEIFHLKRCLSMAEEIQPKPGLFYNSSKAHITEQLKNWITDNLEMKEAYVKQKLLELENLGEDSAQKMTTTLTVGELALITRLFIEGGVYVVKNKKVLSHFMTRNFVTIQKDIDEEFSPDHFYNSLSKVNDATIDSVAAILNRMKARLDKIKEKRNSNVKV